MTKKKDNLLIAQLKKKSKQLLNKAAKTQDFQEFVNLKNEYYQVYEQLEKLKT